MTQITLNGILEKAKELKEREEAILKRQQEIRKQITQEVKLIYKIDEALRSALDILHLHPLPSHMYDEFQVAKELVKLRPSHFLHLKSLIEEYEQLEKEYSQILQKKQDLYWKYLGKYYEKLRERK